MKFCKPGIKRAALPLVVALVSAPTLSAPAHAAADSGERKISLNASMLLNEDAIGDASPLVDEQAAVGDPGSGQGKAPSRPYFPGWTGWMYPVHIAIDLGARHRITRVFLYNETGQHDMSVSYGKPFAWTEKKFNLNLWKQWQEVPVGAETRWLRLTLNAPTSLPEIVVYGEPLEKPVPPPKPPASHRAPQPTMDQMIGANVFIDDPLDTIAPIAGFAREYHSWAWDVEAKDNLRRFQPSAAGGGWRFDDYYAGLKKRGVTVAPTIQMSLPSVFGNPNASAKPIKEGADSEAPASYALHAEHMFQYAARYGSRKVDDSRLILAPGQPRLSGLGLLRYLEDWNEPDKTWEGRAGLFKPYDLAAMSSADLDGDQGRMGKNVGIRNADPTMRMSIGGLAGLNLDVLKAMKFWADYHRGGHFPADVINLHHYSSDGNEQGFKPNGHGISPEADHFREKIEQIAAWRDANVPEMELWVTEFGYDTNPGSPIHVPTLGSMSAEQVQAAWLLRDFLALAAAGVDRTAMFMLRDVDSKAPGVFATCGLVTQKGEWKPKPSWYATATLRNRLAGMRFAAQVPTGRPDVMLYRFTSSGKPARSAYVVWCPTSEDKHIANFRLPIPAKAAHVVRMATGKTSGEESVLPAGAGGLTLTVSEMPQIVLVP